MGKYILGLSIVVVAIAVALILKFRKKSKNGQEEIEYSTSVVDDVLRMSDVVAYFKSLSLNQDLHTPFLALELDVLQHIISKEDFHKEGYKTIVLGVYEETIDCLKYTRLVYCKDFDEKLKEAMGEEKLVVLQ